MPRSSKNAVEETKCELLAYLSERAAGHRPRVACVSLRRMAAELGISEVRVRRALNCLVREERLECSYRYAENGGQLENAYRLTDKGRTWLLKASRFPETVKEE